MTKKHYLISLDEQENFLKIEENNQTYNYISEPIEFNNSTFDIELFFINVFKNVFEYRLVLANGCYQIYIKDYNHLTFTFSYENKKLYISHVNYGTSAIFFLDNKTYEPIKILEYINKLLSFEKRLKIFISKINNYENNILYLENKLVLTIKLTYFRLHTDFSFDVIKNILFIDKHYLVPSTSKIPLEYSNEIAKLNQIAEQLQTDLILLGFKDDDIKNIF